MEIIDKKEYAQEDAEIKEYVTQQNSKVPKKERYCAMIERGEDWYSQLMSDSEFRDYVTLLDQAVRYDVDKAKVYLKKWIYENIELVAYYPGINECMPDGFKEIGEIIDGVLGYTVPECLTNLTPLDYIDSKVKIYQSKTALSMGYILSHEDVISVIGKRPYSPDNQKIVDTFVKASNGISLYFESESSEDMETIRVYFPQLPEVLQKHIIFWCEGGSLYATERTLSESVSQKNKEDYSQNCMKYERITARIVAALRKIYDAVGRVVAESQDVCRPLHKAFKDEQAASIFAKAVDAGLMEQQGEGYKWVSGNFRECVYFAAMYNTQIWNKPRTVQGRNKYNNEKMSWTPFQATFGGENYRQEWQEIERNECDYPNVDKVFN